jgi:4-carboxymuconolactone decarboxylase
MRTNQDEQGRPLGAIAYPDAARLPRELQDALTQRGSLNVYRMIMHSPGMAPGFLELAGAVLQANSLPPHWRELVILRVGRAYGAAYEVHHHTNLARWSGLTDTAIAAVATGAAEGLPDDEAAILGWTDQLLANHTLDDSEREAVLDLLSVNRLTDLVLTVGFYQLVCNFLNTFSVTTDGEAHLS